MSSAALLTEEDLKNWTAYKRQGDLENFLIENGIPYYRGKEGKIITTLGLIEAAKASKPVDEAQF